MSVKCKSFYQKLLKLFFLYSKFLFPELRNIQVKKSIQILMKVKNLKMMMMRIVKIGGQNIFIHLKN